VTHALVSTLPVPDAVGIYGFPDALLDVHNAWQEYLAELRGQGADDIVELAAPHGGARYLIARRRPRGRPVLAIEPHHDDLVLSASGLLLARPAPLTVVTVFTRSASVHPDLSARYPGMKQVTALRAAEAQASLLPLGADRYLLGHKDADPPYRPFDPAVLEMVVEQLRPIVAAHPDAQLLAPAAVTRHPDHLLVHEAARRLGCTCFWEDVAFWPTYALSADDRQLFRARTAGTVSVDAVDVTGAILDKLTLLHLHASQMQPLSAMYRPVRYAFTAARALPPGTGALYAERFYRPRGGAR
jgi:LmbE family N-acetylglucosaminyl deacetylase